MNNPFDYIPSAECREAFAKLTAMIESLKSSGNPADVKFLQELEEGKMLGVLIASDSWGQSHTLYAFSGQLGGAGFHHPGFVGPVFDYLHPEGHFKTKEADISRQNREIADFETNTLDAVRKDFENAKATADAKFQEYKEFCLRSKLQRDARRKAGVADEAEIAAMTRQSQFEKAELRRLKQRLALELEPFANKLKDAENQLSDMKQRRKEDSENLQEWLFSNFTLLNGMGESKSLSEIFANTVLKTPPSGAGECCAPKLLQEAYLRGWHPESMAEFWYGKPKDSEVRLHGMHYPACRGKCLPVLSWMLQGIDIEGDLSDLGNIGTATKEHEPEIIFENEWFCVVNKPSGMLSVPGKGAEISVEQWLAQKYGDGRSVKVAHRLDQDTSGLLIATFGDVAFKTMQMLFATRRVRKTYVAVLNGDHESAGIPRKGRIELPLSPDWLDRPRQRVDFENGKEAVTEYEFVGGSDGCSRVVFHPLTGRTHQLRVHSASNLGLGMPIVGDRLYGTGVLSSERLCANMLGNNSERLLLHAQKIEFTFPIDCTPYSFQLPSPF